MNKAGQPVLGAYLTPSTQDAPALHLLSLLFLSGPTCTANSIHFILPFLPPLGTICRYLAPIGLMLFNFFSLHLLLAVGLLT